MKLLNLNLDFRFFKRRFFTTLDLNSRLRILKKEIRESQPDLITFQEITDWFGLLALKSILIKYAFVFDQQWLKVSGGVVSLYDPKQWRLDSKEFVAFHDQGKFFSRQLADRILRKGILLAVLTHRQSGRKILLVNLHLTANYGQKIADEERKILKIQLAQIKKKVGRLEKDTDWQVVAGDFNADFSHAVIQNWVKGLDFRPVFAPKYLTVCPTKNPLCHRDQKKDFQIDNVLSRHFSKAKGRLVFNRPHQYLSDHYGQLVRLEI